MTFTPDNSRPAHAVTDKAKLEILHYAARTGDMSKIPAHNRIFAQTLATSKKKERTALIIFAFPVRWKC
jgi:hypothetical protein